MNDLLPSISDRDFARFQRLIEDEAGIFLAPVKKELLVGRLSKRLRILALPSFAAYLEYVVSGVDEEERVRMLDCICTNETHFFREPAHFAFMKDVALPSFASAAANGQRPRRLRVWSAGCSTGEEPYSIAMLLLRYFPPQSGWDLSVIASDLSTRVLTQARQARYSEERARELPDAMARQFIKRERREEDERNATVTLVPALRDIVEFRRVNLAAVPFPALGRFDLVFCRNVMIYFRPPTKQRVVTGLLEQLADDGYLFLGHAESLLNLRSAVRTLGPTIYARSRVHAREDSH
jgi:chemotaxis protein methyltransferase CheR